MATIGTIAASVGSAPMPRYYFHIREHEKFEEDPEGAEFASLEEARQEATAAAREMVSEAVLHDEIIDGRTFEVTLPDGTVVAIIPFRSVVRL
ncbi:MAG TPA: hypothetical protein VGO22_18565 [Pseudorhizobium sp.]|jgi:hypothetical protein|nr:hypothetical protein [Pseudorhizobium sp.]